MLLLPVCDLIEGLTSVAVCLFCWQDGRADRVRLMFLAEFR